MDFQLGMNAKAYYGAADTPLVNLVELTNVKDVNLSLDAGEADVTTRANSGWRATAATLKEASAEFEMVWKPRIPRWPPFATPTSTGPNWPCVS